MIENPDFNNGSRLPVRLTRRKFLELTLSATAITACGVLLYIMYRHPEQAAGELGCRINQSLEIPSSYINDLEEVIAPLTKLMPSIRQNVTIEVIITRIGMNDQVHGLALRANNEIRIFIPDDSPENMAIGKATAFHETVHLFDQGNKKPSDYLKEEVKKRTGRNQYTPDEFKILTESSYCNITACGNAGHPESNFEEVFASSITILRFYPSEFIEKLEDLNNPESKRFLATNGRVCIDALKKFSAIPVEYSDLPFDPKLVAYLLQEGQPSVP